MDNYVDGNGKTALRFPAPLTESEQDDFLSNHGITEFYSVADGTVAERIEKYLGESEQALLWEVIREGKVDNLFLQSIVRALGSFMSRTHCFNMLLTARRVAEISEYSSRSFVTFHCIVRRLTDNELPGDGRIHTEARLAGYTAAVVFAMDPSMAGRGMMKEPRRTGHNSYQSAIANEHLERLILERPEQLHDIIAYIKERGMHRTNKTPVEGLRLYLDARQTALAVSEGWL